MTPVPPAGKNTSDASAQAERRREALALIRSRRTMVLATGTAATPWATPVYYAYSPRGFYFFSSPDARHIIQALAPGTAAAAIFSDSDQWEEIQGVQMSGSVRVVDQPLEQIEAGARFVAKFPFARTFLRSGGSKGGSAPQLGDKVRLYVLTPDEVFYVNNRLGFGLRLPIELHSTP